MRSSSASAASSDDCSRRALVGDQDLHRLQSTIIDRHGLDEERIGIGVDVGDGRELRDAAALDRKGPRNPSRFIQDFEFELGLTVVAAPGLIGLHERLTGKVGIMGDSAGERQRTGIWSIIRAGTRLHQAGSEGAMGEAGDMTAVPFHAEAEALVRIKASVAHGCASPSGSSS